MTENIPIWQYKEQKYSNCWKLVDRRNFVPENRQAEWVNNAPVRIGSNQTTSQPTLITNMLKHMHIEKILSRTRKIRVLDIGSGSGVVTALIACIIGKGPKCHNKASCNEVIGIDIYQNLVHQASNNVKKIRNKDHFASMKFRKMDAYQLLLHPTMLGKFDLIYVGAEPKKPSDIQKFKRGVPKLLTKGGIAIGPLEGVLQRYEHGYWEKLDVPIRFVPLQNIKKHHTTRKHHGGKSVVEKKQKRLIKEEHASRTSLKCEESDKMCDIVAITGRSAKLYRNHLFPDFKSMNELKKWSKDKCIIDVGSGINTIYNKSFLAMLTRNKLGRDVLGVDIAKVHATRKHKRHARFVKGNIKTLKLKKLKLNKRCKKKIVLINNLLYLWIDKPSELMKSYKNLFSWLTPGSQIRIFPVYFGRYDMYNKKLKDFIDSKCKVEIREPKITAEEMYEWDSGKKSKVYLKKPLLKDEKNINKRLGAKTLILTMK